MLISQQSRNIPDPWGDAHWGDCAWGGPPWVPAPVIFDGGHMWLLSLKIGTSNGTKYAYVMRRDLLDNLNYKMAVWVDLSPLFAEGYLSPFAWVYVLGGKAHISTSIGLGSYYYNPSLANAAVYRVDSVSGTTGTFTRIRADSVVDNGGINWAFVNYAPETSGGTIAKYYSNGHWDAKYSCGRCTYTDSRGSHDFPGNQTIAGTLWLSAYGPTLIALKPTFIEQFCPKALADTYLGNDNWVLSYVDNASWSVMITGINGYSTNSVNKSNINNNAILFATGKLPTLYTYTRPRKIAQPVAMSPFCNYAITWGQDSIWTDTEDPTYQDTWIDSISQSSQPMPSISYNPIDFMVGMMGSNAELLVFLINGSSDGCYWSSYYAVRNSDVKGSKRISIYSQVRNDGSILHLEGAEDPHPKLMLDDTLIYMF
jgi:hypothetical protein